MNSFQIARDLVDHVLELPATGGPKSAVNRALATLRGRIETKLAELEKRDGVKDKWRGVMEIGGKNQPLIRHQFQAHVCKWDDLKSGNSKPLEYKRVDRITKRADSAGSLIANAEDRTAFPKTGEITGRSRIGKYVIDYFNALFRKPGAPLAKVGQILDELDRQGAPTHRVTLSLDYYYMRPISQIGLHKDTTGNTIFVGLHYDNLNPMLGPEYVYDFWPKFKERLYSPEKICDGPDDNGVWFWPKGLREGLEFARKILQKRQIGERQHVHMTEMDPLGLICFVDELIFHQTPLTKRRARHQLRSYNDAQFNGVTIDLVKEIGLQNLEVRDEVPTLRRQFSFNEKDKQWGDGASLGGKTRRSFVRFWAMVEPTAWFAA
jgi:hypothetical protein